MRACFLGQNVCALGYGVAMVQTPPLGEAKGSEPEPAACPKDAPPRANRMFEDLKRHAPHQS